MSDVRPGQFTGAYLGGAVQNLVPYFRKLETDNRMTSAGPSTSSLVLSAGELPTKIRNNRFRLPTSPNARHEFMQSTMLKPGCEQYNVSFPLATIATPPTNPALSLPGRSAILILIRCAFYTSDARSSRGRHLGLKLRGSTSSLYGVKMPKAGFPSRQTCLKLTKYIVAIRMLSDTNEDAAVQRIFHAGTKRRALVASRKGMVQ